MNEGSFNFISPLREHGIDYLNCLLNPIFIQQLYSNIALNLGAIAVSICVALDPTKQTFTKWSFFKEWREFINYKAREFYFDIDFLKTGKQ
ncbi:MAG: hypothetical protein ACFB12_19300, partial [Leptolyngbyaceae cyanobacterium]